MAKFNPLVSKNDRGIILSRNEAEDLVILLEDCDPKQIGTWRHDIAAQIRQNFGMVSFEEEKEKKNG